MDLHRCTWAPDPDGDPALLTYTFGGVAPVASIRPGSVLDTWTLDCFAGAVRSITDLPSEVCDPRMLNPQTGPFFVEGAEPGDTLAVHFVSITPRGGRGVSSTVPLFGALTSTPTTASLHRRCPSAPGSTRSTWRRTSSATPHATHSSPPIFRSTRCTAPSAWRLPWARPARR